MTKTLKSSLIILVSLSLFSACTQEQSQDKSSTDKITLAATTSDVGFLVFIAEEMGYFKDNDLEVTVNVYESGKRATEDLVAGKADVSTGSDFVFVSYSFANPDLRTFGVIATARDKSLISRIDHGIEKPEDLKGKKIGITKKSSGEFLLGRFLTFNKLSMADVEIIDLKPSEIRETIAKGDIDAALTWEPHIYTIRKKLGENAVVWPGQSGQDFHFLLITTKDWLKSHSSSAERLLKSFIQAERFATGHKKEAKKFLQTKFKYTPDYVDYNWTNIRFVVKLPQALLLVMEDQAQWRIENKLTNKKQIPNYLDYIYINGLKNLKPDAVTIIH